MPQAVRRPQDDDRHGEKKHQVHDLEGFHGEPWFSAGFEDTEHRFKNRQGRVELSYSAIARRRLKRILLIMTNTERAQQFASKVSSLSPKLWIRGEKIRVYLRYPRPYQGGCGGGEMGYVDFSGSAPTLHYRTDAELNAQIKAAL